MSFENISFGKLALIFIAAGVILVFVLLGSSSKGLFSSSVTEQVTIKFKNADSCVIEASDKIPRSISVCQYEIGDTISVTFKPQQPAIESHSLVTNNTVDSK